MLTDCGMVKVIVAVPLPPDWTGANWTVTFPVAPSLTIAVFDPVARALPPASLAVTVAIHVPAATPVKVQVIAGAAKSFFCMVV